VFQRIFASSLIGLLSVNLCGCAVMMAARAPGKKDMSVLVPGASRSQVVAELGSPLQSNDGEFGPVDVFSFKQGYTPAIKATRAVAHATADVATLALWEFVGTPLESATQGEDVQVEVAYDAANRVERIEYFAGAHLAKNGPTLAPWLRGEGTRQTAIVGRQSERGASRQQESNSIVQDKDRVRQSGVIHASDESRGY
jgi:hypothetical protein